MVRLQGQVGLLGSARGCTGTHARLRIRGTASRQRIIFWSPDSSAQPLDTAEAKAYSQDELERRFGRDKMTTVVGPRGTTFIADTLGVHRGVSPIARPRLILQVQYSLLPVFAFLYERFEARTKDRSLAGEQYCNRLVAG